jgi:hypothetical protein
MHTIIVISIGIALLGTCIIGGYLYGGHSAIHAAARDFIPLWFVGAAINLIIGVRRAGYSVAEEAPIFLVVFGVPAAFALLIWLRFR